MRLKNNELLKNNPNFESNILLDKSLMIKFLIPSLLYTGCYTDTRSFRVADTKSFHQLREMLEHENNVLFPDIISNMLEYASPVSYRGKFADYLVEHNRVKIFNNGVGLVIFDEIDSKCFPLINKKNVVNDDVGLPRNFVKIFPPENGGSLYSLSIRSYQNCSFCAFDVAHSFSPSGGGHENASGCSIKEEDLINSEYVREIVKKLTDWSDKEYDSSNLSRNLELLRTFGDNEREALMALALSRGDYEETLKLSNPSYSLRDVGGIYINKYIATLALILEAIPVIEWNDLEDN